MPTDLFDPDSLKSHEALDTILLYFMREDRREWIDLIPRAFWPLLIRSQGLHEFREVRRPRFVQFWLEDIVFKRLPPVLQKKSFLKRIEELMLLMRVATGPRDLKHMLDRVFPILEQEDAKDANDEGA